MTHVQNPFRLSLKPNWLSTTVEKILALDGLAKFYELRPNQATEQPSQHVDAFLDYTLNVLGAKLKLQTQKP